MTDDHALDLSPRTDGDAPAPTPGSRSRLTWLALGGIGLAIAFVLWQALTSATVFFYNVDEAVARQAELGDDTFRMQGTVVTEAVIAEDGSLEFEIGFDGERASIVHVGDEPSDLFEVGIAVVVQGRWEDTGSFRSEQILVKHSESYEAENQDRLTTDPSVDYDS